MVLAIYIIMPFFLKPMCQILQGVTDSKRLIYFYSLEIAIGLGISLYYFVVSYLEKITINWKDILKMFGAFLLLSIATLPNYFVQYMFGEQVFTKTWEIKGFTQYHRLLVYMNFIIPFLIYFLLQRIFPYAIIRL